MKKIIPLTSAVVLGYLIGAIHGGSNVASVKCREEASRMRRVSELAREGDLAKIQAMAHGVIRAHAAQIQAIGSLPARLTFAFSGFTSTSEPKGSGRKLLREVLISFPDVILNHPAEASVSALAKSVG